MAEENPQFTDGADGASTRDRMSLSELRAAMTRAQEAQLAHESPLIGARHLLIKARGRAQSILARAWRIALTGARSVVTGAWRIVASIGNILVGARNTALTRARDVVTRARSIAPASPRIVRRKTEPVLSAPSILGLAREDPQQRAEHPEPRAEYSEPRTAEHPARRMVLSRAANILISARSIVLTGARHILTGARYVVTRGCNSALASARIIRSKTGPVLSAPGIPRQAKERPQTRAANILSSVRNTLRQNWKPLARATAAIGVVLTVVAGASYVGDIRVVVGPAALTLTQVVAAVSSVAKEALSARPMPAQPVATRRAAVGSSRVARRPAASTPPLPVPTLEESPAVDLAQQESPAIQPEPVDLVQASEQPAPVEAPSVEVVDSSIYSADDADVQSPKLLSAGFAGLSVAAASSLTNTLELIVSPVGTVEQARLLTPPRRMADTMLLGSAKSWQFSPALKGDRPVRYRLAMSWDVNP